MEDDKRQQVMQKIKELQQLRIFNRLDEREVFEIMKRSQLVQYEADQPVFAEGDRDDSMYIIISGTFEVYVNRADGDKMPLFVAGQGLVFGEMSFLDHQPRSAFVVTQERSEALKFTRERFEELLQSEPAVAAKFMFCFAEILSRRLRGANQRLKHAT